MHKYYGDAINTVNDTIPVYLREEDKVVYGIVPDGITYGDCPIGCYYDYTIDYKLKNGEEFVLYDFHDPQSYWSNLLDLDSGFFQDFVLNYTENMQVGNHWPKVYTFEGFKMIEGIGIDGYDSSYSGYTLFPFWPIIVGKGAVWFQFRYLVEDGEIVYKGIHYTHDAFTGINEVVMDKARPMDDNYYNLMGQPVGKDVPTAPGIYIHQGKKIVVR